MKNLLIFLVCIHFGFDVYGVKEFTHRIYVPVRQHRRKQMSVAYPHCLREAPSRIKSNTARYVRRRDRFKATIYNITKTGFTVELGRPRRYRTHATYWNYKAYFDNSYDFVNPCLNGGTCRNTFDGTECSCRPTFAGKHCQTHILEGNVRLSLPPEGDVVNIAYPVCIRDAPDKILSSDAERMKSTISNITRWGFTGHVQRVDYPGTWWGQWIWKAFYDSGESYVTADPCLNGGRCSNHINGHVCGCSQEFVGKHCEIRLVHCFPNPCQHGGSCRERRDGFQCQCSTGFWGRRCSKRYVEGRSIVNLATNQSTGPVNISVNYDYCYKETASLVEAMATSEAFEPPQVVAVNRVSQFGFQGYIGESRTASGSRTISWKAYFGATVNYINLCENYGTCVNSDEGHRCQCRQPYGGELCKEVLPRCDFQPCHNGGYCTNMVNSFYCSCREGFGGSDCSQHLETGHFMVPWRIEEYKNQMVAFDQCYRVPAQSVTLRITNLGNYPNDYVAYVQSVTLHGFHARLRQQRSACFRPRSQLLVTWTAYFASQSNYNKSRCMNGATCRNTIREQICDCAPGFKGRHCEIAIRNCSTNPCKNNGSCSHRTDGFVCECQAGYEGEDCSLKSFYGRAYAGAISEYHDRSKRLSVIFDKCYHTPPTSVQVNLSSSLTEWWFRPTGVSVSHISRYGFTAEVHRIYYGAGRQEKVTMNWKASIDSEQYNDTSCNAGAKCEDDGYAQFCSCKAGYSGSYCEINNKCDPDPCQNGGTCFKVFDGYKCLCPFHFFGQNCTLVDDFLVEEVQK